MRTLYSILLLGQLIILPAFAGGDVGLRPRLVPGGVDIAQGDTRVELLTSQSFSVGSISPMASQFSGFTTQRQAPSSSANAALYDKLAMGGYVAYSLESYSLSSAIRNRESSTSADVSASYVGALMGYQGTTAVTVGYDWRKTSSLFSTNPQSSGVEALDALTPGVSVSLSWNHSITPSLYFGGFASAQHMAVQSDEFLPQSSNAFRLGAGVGLKF